ncbi:kinase, partial [Thraustotheca clavata]
AQQREDMHAVALESNRVSVLSREALIRQVANGTLINISLDEIPNGFELLSDSKSQSILWRGEMEQVSFVLQPTQAHSGNCLFKCTIIVGAKVTQLRTYILAHPSHIDDSNDIQLLESTMENLNRDSCTRIAYMDLDMKELIGTGAGGDSYRAFYQGQEVVVKTIRASEFGDSPSSIVQSFEHEAAILQTFGHHPHIVPFVGACCDPSYPLSLITSYVPLGSLESHYSSLSLLDKDIILSDIANATSTIHASNFVHRDLAARNCLVDLNHRGILADFGLCRRISSLGGSFISHAQGPLKYMAPETLQPPYTFTTQSDSYSFGVLMWETLSASTPFASLSPVQAAVRVLEGQRLPTLQLSPIHRSLLERCFAADPSSRPSMQQIATQLKDRGSEIALMGDKKQRKVGVPKFLRYLYQMLETEDPSIIAWALDGSSIQILNMEAVANNVLPKYFKHSNYASFQRQLNYFGFRKWTKSQTNICTFSHPEFRQNRPDRLCLIKRKNRPERVARRSSKSMWDEQEIGEKQDAMPMKPAEICYRTTTYPLREQTPTLFDQMPYYGNMYRQQALPAPVFPIEQDHGNYQTNPMWYYYNP